MDRDDLACVGRLDAQALAGDHDHSVAGDLALDADRPGGRCGQLRGGDAGAEDLRALIGGNR